MQKNPVLIKNNRMCFGALDITDFLGFVRPKYQVGNILLDFEKTNKKTWSPPKLNFGGLHVFRFFKI